MQQCSNESTTAAQQLQQKQLRRNLTLTLLNVPSARPPGASSNKQSHKFGVSCLSVCWLVKRLNHSDIRYQRGPQTNVHANIPTVWVQGTETEIQ